MKKQSLKDIANILMGQSPPGASCNITGNGEPLLNGPTEFGSYNPIPKQFTNAGKRYCDDGDILFCVRGSTTGRMNWADRSYVLGRGLAAVKHKYDKDLNHYLKYLIEFNLTNILKSTSGSTFPNLSKDSLQDFKFVVLEKDDQKNLSQFLRKIDQKIELNNRINRELEGMAKLLYDYWFVQFDFPISEEQAIAMGKPELKGKPYKSSGGPMAYNEQLKREVPEGWGVDNILQVSNLLGGGTPKTTVRSYWDGCIPFYTPTDAEKTVFKISTAENITELGLKNSSTRLFPKGIIFITARGSVGNVIITGCEMAMNQSCYALSPKKDVGSSFLYFATQALVSNFKAKSSGSVFKSIVSNDIKYTLLPIPSLETIKCFSEISHPSFDKILVNLKENQQLTELRDWLLPMLMNGQVRVGEDKKEYKAEGEVLMAAERREEYEK